SGGVGVGIAFLMGPTGSLAARVEGNNFVSANTGVEIETAGSSVSNIDLGGGKQGSLGSNNFRLFTSPATPSSGAIVIFGPAGDTVSAKNNLFSSGDPESFVYDHADSSTDADAVLTGAASGAAAFVQALYVRFLDRIGNLADSHDAGFWLNQLSVGGSAGS